VGQPPVSYFVDACCGVGTLGLAAACLGVSHVVLNDAWYASAFWSAFNLEINRSCLNITRVKIFEQLHDLQRHPVMADPIKIAETTGEQVIEVYQGDFHKLYTVITPGSNPVTVLDIFDKNDKNTIQEFSDEWLKRVGGEVFVP
jgi:ribosomal protein L11 methylase PrmA